MIAETCVFALQLPDENNLTFTVGANEADLEPHT